MSGKADLTKRAVAMIIDSVIASLLSIVPYIGGLVGTAYMVLRDGLDIDFMNKRSVGKQLMGLKPVRLDGQRMDPETSVRRNWMWGIGAITGLLLYIPIVGWLLIPVVTLISFGVGLFELYKVLTDAEGRRWGDAMAGTKVIESTNG